MVGEKPRLLKKTTRLRPIFYRKLVADLTSIGFEINPYDPCVANKIIDGKQMTICWHVDDLYIGHEDPHVVTTFLEWLAQW